jgi:hypothetical protein
MMISGVLLFSFSIFLAFLSSDALDLVAGVFRVILSVLLILALRFEDPSVQEAAVLVFSAASLILMALVRSEVQIRDE